MMINFNRDSFFIIVKRKKNIDCKKLRLSAATALACCNGTTTTFLLPAFP
jgi:hypothetical protein